MQQAEFAVLLLLLLLLEGIAFGILREIHNDFMQIYFIVT